MAAAGGLDWEKIILKFTTATESKVYIIHCTNRQERKKIHQYFEEKNILAASLLVKNLSYKTERYISCFECGNRGVLGTYHRGIMENNIDEYYSGTCPKCGESCDWECNYDGYDSVSCKDSNNVIVLDRMFRGMRRPHHSERGHVSQEEFEQIVNKLGVYTIDQPPVTISKRHRTHYTRHDLQIHLESLDFIKK